MGKIKLLILIVALFAFTNSDAQFFIPGSMIDYTYRGSLLNNKHVNDTSANAKKWFVSKYSGISTTFSFYKGGNATVIAAPIGLQLNRKLNNNLFAFGRLSIAPAYVSFNQSFLNSDFNKTGMSSFKANGLSLYSRAELGLQYINDERTFSISGSIGVERSSYPAYIPGNNRGTRIIPNNY